VPKCEMAWIFMILHHKAHKVGDFRAKIYACYFLGEIGII
jgi:hypothetical protein